MVAIRAEQRAKSYYNELKAIPNVADMLKK